MIHSHFTATAPSAEALAEPESRWSHVGTSSIAHVLSVVNTEIDRIERKMPKSRGGRRLSNADLIARDFLDGCYIVCDDLRDELLYELDGRRGGAR